MSSPDAVPTVYCTHAERYQTKAKTLCPSTLDGVKFVQTGKRVAKLPVAGLCTSKNVEVFDATFLPSRIIGTFRASQAQACK